MNVSPAGSGNITSPQFLTPPAYPADFDCSINYTLTAVPNSVAGYDFVEWVVNATTETDNPLTVSVDDGVAKYVTAFFRIADTPNTPPTANAGMDQTVIEYNRVTLDGSGSFDPDYDIRSYLWQQTAGPDVALSNASAISPTFTAPDVGLNEGPVTLTFQLTVEDLLDETDTDTVTITVQDSGSDPPTADAGEDQIVSERTQVTLDGSGSFDPNNDIRSYFWEQTEGIEVILSDTSLVRPTFTAPDVEVTEDPMTLIFKLTVEDANGQTDDALVTISVRRGPIGGSSSSAGCFISGAAAR